MKTRREREAELVALMLFDMPHLRTEFWRVVCTPDYHPPLAALSSQELIRGILEKEYPGEAGSQPVFSSSGSRRRPR